MTDTMLSTEDAESNKKKNILLRSLAEIVILPESLKYSMC
jgi:hypothetical protein